MPKQCGCTTPTCGCCEGTKILTPAAIENRPGLPAIDFRVGTHGSFFETMKARLSTMTVDVTDATGKQTKTLQPLLSLTTRDTSDLSIALLDSWATVADVLTFYQERIANEGYLRTATERESVLELARLIGYELRPGVAASVFLAYTIDKNQTKPVVIPAGSSSQSIPLQNTTELPQPFETSADLTAQKEWNDLQVRLTRPQDITTETIWDLPQLYVDPSVTNIKTGDQLLFVFDDTGAQSFVRKVASMENQAADNRILIHLQPNPAALKPAYAVLKRFVTGMNQYLAANPDPFAKQVVTDAAAIMDSAPLGLQTDPSKWVATLERRDAREIKDMSGPPKDLWNRLTSELKGIVGGGTTGGGGTTSPSAFVSELLLPLPLQPRSSLSLPRSLASIAQRGSDLQPQLLINFAPQLQNTFYTAWAGATVNDAVSPLQAVYALRSAAAAYGASAPDQVTYDPNKPGVPQFTPWGIAGDEAPNLFYLEQPNEAIQSSSFALVQVKRNSFTVRSVHQIAAVETGPRNQYGIGGKTTQLNFADDWWQGTQDQITTLQGAYAYAQSEALKLVDEPITEPVGATDAQVELDGVYDGLKSGMWVIFSGQRSDIPNVAGVPGAELAMISGVTQSFNKDLPGDSIHTSIQLQTDRAYSYTRDSLSIYANVVKATHGQTVNETLGSGDGAQTLQSFKLSRPPLTFVSAPNASGVQSTLQVYVNNVQWQETNTLADVGPKDQKFITQTDNSAITSITFGDGQNGARLPTGVLNVAATYRTGIGQPGNVLAGQISMLTSKPLGVTAVNNPLDASGGADAESLNDARANAPLAVMSLGRIVSLQDYADFARTFAGIGKAQVMQLSDGHRQLIYLTVAGADDIPIDPTSDLYLNLVEALKNLGDASLALQVDVRELVTLVLSAKVRIDPRYLWDPVAAQIQSTLQDEFGFQNRDLAQPALLCEIIAAIQNTPGVVYVDVDAFGGIPEKTIGPHGPVLLTLDQIARQVERMTAAGETAAKPIMMNEILADRAVNLPGKPNLPYQPPSRIPSGPAQIVRARPGRLEKGFLRPAELAIFSPSVPDTIVLSQIK